MCRISIVAAALVLAGCSSGADEAVPPATRETVAPAATTVETTITTTTTDTAAVASGPETAVESTDPTITTTAAATTTTVPESISFSIDFENQGNGVDAGWLTVPVDYADPTGDTLDLWVTRHRTESNGRIGALLLNNGGPGLPASSMAENARGWVLDPMFDRFDIVSWDPRGTGVSGGSVDCIDDTEFDRYFGSSDPTPETPEERQELIDLAADFAASCVAQDGQLLPYLGTNNSARDMDAIRQALGEEQVSFLGFSYGSELGAVWATLFPDTVRAAVLDGAANPDPTGLEPVKQQQIGFEGVLSTFLARCSEDSSCVFHNDGDAEGAFDRLLADLDENPIPSADGRPSVGQEIAIGGVIQALYSDLRWPSLERALADAANGDGAGLLTLFDSYFQRDPDDGSYSNLLESFQAITCADEAERLDPEQADERAKGLAGVAPRLFPSTTGAYTCGFFPESADPRIEITGERAGPIVVIGTTGDPTTPLTSSRAMAEALEEGQLVTVEANQHTAYRSGECINDLVHQYMIWLEAPAPDARCS